MSQDMDRNRADTFRPQPGLPNPGRGGALVFLAFLLFLSVVKPSNLLATGSAPGSHPALSVGETLVFSIKWGVVNAGTATMSVTEKKLVSDQDCYHVVATAVSNPVFDKIYPVRDRFESFMDSDNLQSWAFKKHLREGKFRRDQVVRNDPSTQKAYYHNGKSYDIAPGAFDILSAFYFVRTRDLTDGEEFELETHSDRKNYSIKVTVKKREQIEVPVGTFDCVVVEARLEGGEFFQGDGKLIIWLTDDERRMPVQMKSKIPVGSIAVVLKSFERGTEKP